MQNLRVLIIIWDNLSGFIFNLIKFYFSPIFLIWATGWVIYLEADVSILTLVIHGIISLILRRYNINRPTYVKRE